MNDTQFWPPQVGDVWLSSLDDECPWPMWCKFLGELTGAGGSFSAETVWEHHGPLRLIWRDGAAVTAHHISELDDGAPTDYSDFPEALKLLRELTDPDDCEFDHNGGCQAHGYISLQLGETCPHADAKQLIARHTAAGEED